MQWHVNANDWKIRTFVMSLQKYSGGRNCYDFFKQVKNVLID